MCIKQVVRTVAALAVMVVGLAALVPMLKAELSTATVTGYHNYFQWALQAGILCLSVGLSYIIYCGEDKTATTAEDTQAK